MEKITHHMGAKLEGGHAFTNKMHFNRLLRFPLQAWFSSPLWVLHLAAGMDVLRVTSLSCPDALG